MHILEIHPESFRRCSEHRIRRRPGDERKMRTFGLGVVQGGGPDNTARMQRNSDSGPITGGMPIHAAERNDNPARGSISGPPEPPFHLGAVRRHRIAERKVCSGPSVPINQTAAKPLGCVRFGLLRVRHPFMLTPFETRTVGESTMAGVDPVDAPKGGSR